MDGVSTTQRNDNSPAGSVWKMTRKLSQQILNVSTARSYVQYQDLESKAMLVDLLESPHEFIDHLRRFTASLTTQMIFGHRTKNIEDPRFKTTFHVSPSTDSENRVGHHAGA